LDHNATEWLQTKNLAARLRQIKAARREMTHDDATDWLSKQVLVMTGSRGISRRHVLTIAASAAGASIAGGTALIGTSTPAQAAKAPQKVVKYQDTPKGEQRCDNCDLFEAPSSCKNVDGIIAPQGWCIVYRKKQA
jgi:hypothetical protein